MAQARGLDLKASAVYTMFPFIAMTVFCLAGGVLGDWIASRHGLRAGRCGPGFFSLLVARDCSLSAREWECSDGRDNTRGGCGRTVHLAEFVLVGHGAISPGRMPE